MDGHDQRHSVRSNLRLSMRLKIVSGQNESFDKIQRGACPCNKHGNPAALKPHNSYFQDYMINGPNLSLPSNLKSSHPPSLTLLLT
jgi:hypothetical protein